MLAYTISTYYEQTLTEMEVLANWKTSNIFIIWNTPTERIATLQWDSYSNELLTVLLIRLI